VTLDGSRVLVTGASSGIGAATAELLSERGATVGLVARRADRLDEVLERCRSHAPESRRWVCDLGDLDAAVAVGLDAWDTFGHLDAIVHNAAIPRRRAAQDLTPDELDETMRVNFTSPVRMTLALLPRLLERRAGVIVNVGSVGARLGIRHEAAYCASKFALAGWSESLAVDLWHTGVRVRLVNPGPIDTEIWDQPGNDVADYAGPLEPPSLVAEAIASAIEGDRFETYAPDMGPIIEWKNGNIDQFIEGVASS
jgi:NAD(P)-dependent dehydrogenase (short-subunit alcohol dehydrogenase family)